jgi:hypothetical protein
MRVYHLAQKAPLQEKMLAAPASIVSSYRMQGVFGSKEERILGVNPAYSR